MLARPGLTGPIERVGGDRLRGDDLAERPHMKPCPLAEDPLRPILRVAMLRVPWLGARGKKSFPLPANSGSYCHPYN